MIKRLLILGAFCSLSFGGIADDIKLENEKKSKEKEIEQYRESQEECQKMQFNQWNSSNYSLLELEKLYDSASNINIDIEKLNIQYAQKMAKFALLSKEIVSRYSSDEQNRICYEINDVDEYKKMIQEKYKNVIYEQGKSKNEAEIKKIIENEKFDQFKHLATSTIEDLDKYIENAHSLYEKLRQLSTPYEIDTYHYGQQSEEEYINHVKVQRQWLVEKIEREAKYKQQAKQNDKAKKASIPKYKTWKNITVPKFQKSLKAGDYVAGGIVWKVNGNLVVVDTGNRGLVSQRRDQTYPRVPQDLMPLFMDEITGVARY